MTNMDCVSQFDTAYYVHCICIVIGCFYSFLPRFCGALLSFAWVGYYALMYICMPLAVSFSYWLIVYLPFAIQIMLGFDHGAEYLSRPWLRVLKLLWNAGKTTVRAASVNAMIFVDSNFNEFSISMAIIATESFALYDIIRLVITTIQSRTWIVILLPLQLIPICYTMISRGIVTGNKKKVDHCGNNSNILGSGPKKVVEGAQFVNNGKSVEKITQSDSGYPEHDPVLFSTSSKAVVSPPSCLYPKIVVINHCSASTDSLDACSFDRNAPIWSGKDRGISKPSCINLDNKSVDTIEDIVVESSELIENTGEDFEFVNEKKKKSRKKKLMNFFKGCFCLSS